MGWQVARSGEREAVSVSVIMSSEDQSMAFAQELGRTFVAFRYRSYEEFEQALKELEADWVNKVDEWEALEFRRRIAEELFGEAYSRDLDWPRFSSTMERIHALGYSHPLVQVHVAILFARWAHRRHEHEAEAREALDRAEQLVVQADPQDPTTQDMRRGLTKTRADTGYRSGTEPPA